MSDTEFTLIACERDGGFDSACARTSEIDEACAATARFYEQVGFNPPWIGYVAVLSGVAVGGGAFVGAPINNRVEIAYFTLSQHQAKGVATRTAQQLVEIARRTSPGIELYAKTMPETNASTHILTKLGFEMIGTDIDHEIGEAWAWLLR